MRGTDFCRGCNSHKLFRALDLGFSPLANRLISPENMESAEPWYPLILRICLDCSLGQLGEFNTDTEIFRDYPYLSSTSSTWLESNKFFASSMIKMMNLEKNDLVIEIASNDGYLLQYFQDQGIAVLGIEPALNVATIASIKGIPTSPEFFTEHLAKNISKNILETKLIVAKNVVAHVPDIRDFIKGISVISNSKTLIVFEAPTILNILQKTQFDTIYHEHFSYLSASFFENILPDFNLKIIGIEKVETHGGSLRFFITQSNSDVQISKHLIEMLDIVLTEERVAKITEPTNWKELSGVVEKQLEDFRNWVVNSKSKIIGYGAAAKAVTLLSAAQVPRSSIAFCIDNSAGKINLLIPGHQIPIISEADFLEKHRGEEFVFLIFPWNLKKEISERIRSLTSNCRVFVALPTIEEV